MSREYVLKKNGQYLKDCGGTVDAPWWSVWTSCRADAKKITEDVVELAVKLECDLEPWAAICQKCKKVCEHADPDFFYTCYACREGL